MAQVKNGWTTALAVLAAGLAVVALGAPLRAAQSRPLGEDEMVAESEWIGLVR